MHVISSHRSDLVLILGFQSIVDQSQPVTAPDQNQPVLVPEDEPVSVEEPAQKKSKSTITAARVQEWKKEYSWLEDHGPFVDSSGMEDHSRRSLQCRICAAVKPVPTIGWGFRGTAQDKHDVKGHNDSTMMGRWKGVAAQLAKHATHLISVHCIAHRTALIMNDANKCVKGLAEVDKCLKMAHTLFAKSSKKTNAWQSHAAPLGVTQFRFPIFCVTRWFSRMQCLKVLCKNLLVFLVFLLSYTLPSRVESWTAGVKAYNHLSNVHVVAMMFMLQDVVGPVEHLSKLFQQETLLPHHVVTALTTFKLSMKEVLDCTVLRDLPAIGGFLASLQRKVWKYKYQDKEVQVTLVGAHKEDELVAFKDELAGHILQSLEDRFKDTDILAAFKIFDPASYANLDAKSLKKFGEDELQRLCVKFKDVLGLTSTIVAREVYTQFGDMKQHLLAASHEPGCQFIKMWLFVQVSGTHVQFPKMLMLLHIMLVIMVHSADVERMFSLARVTKHRLTNRLNVHTLDSLMRIKCLGPKEVDEIHAYDLSMAIALHADQVCPLLDALFAACAMSRLPLGDDADVNDLPTCAMPHSEDSDDDGSIDCDLFSSIENVVIDPDTVDEEDEDIMGAIGCADKFARSVMACME
jgi:hypothetical protein